MREAPRSLPRAFARLTASQQEAGRSRRGANALSSYADAVKLALPAVVNVYTTKEVRRRRPRRDPFFERFFGGGKSRSDRMYRTWLRRRRDP